MRMRSSLLLGAALSVAGMLSGVSASAQGHTPQVSTPAEAAETQQLNEQAVSGTTQPPAALNGENVSMQTAQAVQPQYDQQQQYEAQQQQYQAQQQRYQQAVRNAAQFWKVWRDATRQ